MKCDKCGQNEASIYIEHEINGQKHITHLCDECASKHTMSIDIDSVFKSFVNSFKAFSPEFTSDDKMCDLKKTCPKCGMTFGEFKKNSKLGCVECYDAFGVELNSIFSNIQPGEIHRGKIPHKFGTEHIQSRELANLKASLKTAVNNEEFEE
ncbi:hypothetical protein LJB89_02175, partial [Tyzzerella sp. OttesenSCG-928-J15]|nr:hypothetical protein [Tyzzerella sp. OttesenSCG-928-J15]